MSTRSGFGAIRQALRNPNYGIYTAGNAASLIGSWMQRVAVGWLTWELTGSGAWLGAMAFADLFPTVIVGPLGGVMADRWDRLRIMRITQFLALCQALTLFALTATGTITVGLLFALTLFLGIVAGINQPVRMALVPSLVRREDLAPAVAINSIIFNAARFVGPAAAGALIASSGTALAFAANAASFVLFMLALWRIRLPSASAPPAKARHGVLHDVAEGVRYVGAHPGLGPMMMMLIASCLFVRPVIELLPGFASDVFGAGAAGLALLTSTIGAGAIVGGLWLAGRGDWHGLTRLVLGNTALLALAILLFIATDSLWVAVPALLVGGTCMVVIGVGVQTLIQLSVAGNMRGRVLSLYGLIFRGGPALGALTMGTVSDLVGLRWPLAVGSALALAAWAAAWTRRTRMQTALEMPQAAD
jgi:predicted MFS family arabinose efflux permease